MTILPKKISMKLKSLLVIFALLSLLTGCINDNLDPIDRKTGTTRNDLETLMYGGRSAKKDDSSKTKNAPSFAAIPTSSRIIAIPTLPQKRANKLVSISVGEDIDLKDVLIELARSANLDLDLDPRISGGVIINANNRPLTQVLDRICKMAELRYSLENGVLNIKRDLPFATNYQVNFLIEDNLWSEVEDNIGELLGTDSAGGSVSSNKLANIVTVFANSVDQQKVAEYLKWVRKNASAQVLIEAKVVEVKLADEYQTGIDWNWNDGAGIITGDALAGSPYLTAIIPETALFGRGLTATINALEKFGETKAISSPRINALNNQPATLNFTKKVPYLTFELSSDTTGTGGSDTTVTNSALETTINEELTGVQLTITPSIDLVRGEITLDVRPLLTVQSDTLTENVIDPNQTDLSLRVVATNRIPIIDTRELQTIGKIKNGSTMVIGGVMTEDSKNENNGVPYLSRIPLLGNLFRSTVKTTSMVETVIFVKATIISPNDGVGKYDRDIHNVGSSSIRPYF
ncbi:MAG: general secretion pathway protein D [Lentimonas sp.]|jgi:general secretion pathway protein D